MPKITRRQRQRRARLSPHFIKRLSSWLVMSTTLTLGVATVTRAAATLFWDSDATAGNGATDGSGTWISGVSTFFNPAIGLDVATGSADIAQFGSGGTLSSVATVNVGTQTVGGLVFGVTSGSGYTLAGNAAGQVLTVGASGLLMLSGAQPTKVGDSNLSLTLGASESWTDSSANSLTVAGNVATGSNILTLGATSSGGIAITGGIGGAGGVTVNSTGSGVVTLSGADNYTGATTVNAGTLILNGTNATMVLGIDGGSLVLSSGAVSAAPSVTFDGGNLTTATQTLGNLSLVAGASSSLTVQSGSTLTLGSGAWSRGADSILDVNLSASGSGITIASAPSGGGAPVGINNIFGYALVTDSNGVTGLGQLNGTTLQRFNSATAATLTGSSNSANTDFTTLNTTYTGGLLDWSGGATPIGPRAVDSLTVDTTKAGGSIFLGGDAASSNPAVLTITSGALVFQGTVNSETLYGGQIGGYNSELDIHQLATGAGTLTIGSVLVSPPGSLQSGIITNSASITGLTTTAGLFVGEAVSGSGIPANTTIASITSGSAIVLSNAATNPAGLATQQTVINFAPGSGSVVKDGGGTVVLTGPSSEIGSLAGSATVGLPGANGLGGTTGLYVGELVSGPGIAPGTTITAVGAGAVTLSAAASASGNASLTFGTQSSYTGGTYIDAGTLQAGSKNSLSPNSTVVLANVAGANLDLNGYDQIIGGLSGGGALGGNILLTNGATLTVGGGLSPLNVATTNVDLANAGVSSTYSGLISGTGNLAITGGEVVYLTNTANSYTGFTDILSGALVINNLGELGASNTTITIAGIDGAWAPGGMLVIQGGSTGMVVNRNIDMSGAGIGQNVNTGIAWESIGSNTYTGSLNVGLRRGHPCGDEQWHDDLHQHINPQYRRRVAAGGRRQSHH